MNAKSGAVEDVVSGKALLVIERLDSKFVPFRVKAFIQSAVGGEWAHDCAHEDFGLLDTDTLGLPDAAYKLSVGDRVRVAVSYAFEYHTDYWGEGDVDLSYRKQRVLRRQPATKRRSP